MCGDCLRRGGAGGPGPIRRRVEGVLSGSHLRVCAGRCDSTAGRDAESHCTSLSLERQCLRRLLTPCYIAEAWSWFTEQSRGLSCHHKVPQTAGLKQQKIIVSQFWRSEVEDQGVSRLGFSCGLLGVPMAAFSLPLQSHLSVPLVFLCVQLSCYKDSSQMGLQSTLTAQFHQFNHNHLFKGPAAGTGG